MNQTATLKFLGWGKGVIFQLVTQPIPGSSTVGSEHGEFVPKGLEELKAYQGPPGVWQGQEANTSPRNGGAKG